MYRRFIHSRIILIFALKALVLGSGCGVKSLEEDLSQKLDAVDNKEDNRFTDTVAPDPGGDGVLTTTGNTFTSVDLSWSKGTDEVTSGTSLVYCAYYSSSELNTVASVESSATAGPDCDQNISSTTVSGLSPETSYYFYVIIKDAEDNKGLYDPLQAQTLENTAPVPGDSGNLSTILISQTGFTINWTKALDPAGGSDQNALEYLAYYSTSNNVDTVANAEANGQAVGDYATDIDSVALSSLSPDTLYYYNVLVRDEAGNVAAYTSGSVTTQEDAEPPEENTNSGAITASIVTPISVTLTWTKATDNSTPQANLSYLAYYSTSNNISTISDAETNGTPIGSYADDIDTVEATGLLATTAYYFNVIVKDSSDNKFLYTTVSAVTLENIPPVPGNGGTLTTSGATYTAMDLNWTKATDPPGGSAQADLEYQVYYSASNNIANLVDAVANGTAVGSYTADIATTNVTGLSAGTTYYFNVIVRDEAGNEAIYNMQSGATVTDTTAPTTGASGALSAASVADTSLTVNWTKGSDDLSVEANLEYLLYQSTSNNIGNVTDAKANGTAVGSYAADIATLNVTGLTPNTSYYFNVLIRDEAGNEAAYVSFNQATLPDTTAPTSGAGGALSFPSVDDTTIDVSWAKGADNATAEANLQYRVFYSTSNNITTLADVLANGTAVDAYQTDITTDTVTGLNPVTTYYFNVLVRDEAGNEAAYTSSSQATSADIVAPTPGAGVLSFSSVTLNSLDVNWPKGTDNASAQANLEYRLYYSTSNNISTLADVLANGMAVDAYSADIDTYNVTGLTPNTTYYFNVLIRDEAGNEAAYPSNSQATLPDTIDPVAGNSGALSFNNVTDVSLDVDWTKGTDVGSAQADLEYRVYYSTSNNIDTLANVLANGTAAAPYATDIDTLALSDLDPNTTYYFNVLIRDEAGNEAAYSSSSQLTLPDTTDPVPGTSGNLSFAGVTETAIDVNWTKGSDNASEQADLEYRVYYSTADNIDTLANVLANGTAAAPYATDIATATVTALAPNTTYYFNVLVRDEAGNEAAYTSGSQATNADVTAPTPGNSGTITSASITTTGLTLNWTKGTDDVSAQANLEYLVYYSSSNNISTVADAELNGTAVDSYAADIATKALSGLTIGNTYYFNVLVRDEANNKASYTAFSEELLDVADTISLAVTGASSITADGVATTTLTATVLDTHGDPFQGEDVTLTIPTDGGTATTNPVSTDASGEAAFTLTSSTVAALYSYSASIAKPSTSNSVNVTFAAGAGAKFVILDPTDGNEDTSISVTVEVWDTNDNLVASYQDDVDLVADGSATGDGTVNIVNGTGSLNISNAIPETVNLTLANPQGTATDVTSTQDVIFAAVNSDPTMDDITNKSTYEDTQIEFIFIVADEGGDADENAQTLSVTSITSDDQTLIPNGNINYTFTDNGNGATGEIDITPASGQTGTATITVVISDGSTTVQDTFDLEVLAAPTDPPTAYNVNATTPADTAVGVTLVAGNETIVSYTVENQPTDGTLSGTAPNLTYTPDTGFSGRDEFTYTATDDDGEISNVAVVSIVVSGSALFSVGGPLSTPFDANADLAQGDLQVYNRIVALGFMVTVKDDNDAQTTDGDNVDLIIISSSVNANGVLMDTYKDVTVPVFTWERFVYDDMEMATSTGTVTTDTITITDGGNPLAGGLSNGNYQVFNSNFQLVWGTPNGNATIVATTAGGDPVLFVYEKDDVMFNSFVAPAKRVGYFLPNFGDGDLSANGYTLLDAAINESLAR